MKLLKNITFPLITAAVVLAVLYYLYLQDQPLRENFESSGGSTFLIVIVVIVVIVGGLMFLGQSSDSSSGSSSSGSSGSSSVGSLFRSSGRAPRPSGAPRSGSVANSETPKRANAASGPPNNAAPSTGPKLLISGRNGPGGPPASATAQPFGGRRGNTKKRRASH